MAITKDTTSGRAIYGKSEDRYLELVRQFPLRPLASDGDLDAAIAMIDSLIDQDKLSAPEQDYLDVLSDLVEAYEAEAVPIKAVDDADLLRFLIENRQGSQPRLRRKPRSENRPIPKCWLASAS